MGVAVGVGAVCDRLTSVEHSETTIILPSSKHTRWQSTVAASNSHQRMCAALTHVPLSNVSAVSTS